MIKKICPKCGSEFEDTSKWGKSFCSRSCANSRTFNNGAKFKKSVAAAKYWAALDDSEKIARKELAKRVNQGRAVEEIMGEDFNVLSFQSKRKRVIIEQKGKCNHCGISEWMGITLTLELEHKDGNNKNNDRDNLEAICPNCHSLTSTWRGRKNKVSKNTMKISNYVSLQELAVEQGAL